MSRKILHIDMDAFFASVEQRDNPELRGKAVAVGGGGNRGVVAAASYEAREFGVHSAMPGVTARRLCPELIFVRPRFDAYRQASAKVFEIFRRATDVIEGLSLDEAYLDVTVNHFNESSATYVAQRIKQMIFSELGLTASAGVAGCKSVAKIASGFNKPNGLTTVPPHRTLEFLHPLPVRKLSGVGPKTEERLKALGIDSIGQLAEAPLQRLTAALGSHGQQLWKLSIGKDDRPVQQHRGRRSQSAESTFSEDVLELSVLEERLVAQATKICARLREKQTGGRTVVLKLRYDDFTTITRSMTLSQATCDAETVLRCGGVLLRDTEAGRRPVRLIGIGLSGLEDLSRPRYLQLPLRFEDD